MQVKGFQAAAQDYKILHLEHVQQKQKELNPTPWLLHPKPKTAKLQLIIFSS